MLLLEKGEFRVSLLSFGNCGKNSQVLTLVLEYIPLLRKVEYLSKFAVSKIRQCKAFVLHFVSCSFNP